MKSLLVVALAVVPSLASAQPYDPAQPPPPPVYATPAPALPPGTPVQLLVPSSIPLRHGMTVELNLGLGYIWARNDQGQESDTEAGIAGLNVGLGGWLNERMALTGRIAGATFSPSDGVRFTSGFLGPSLQYWVDERVWLGGGAGLGMALIHVDGLDEQPDPETGFALDLRIGYTFTVGTEHTFNASFEYNPAFFDIEGGGSVQVNAFGVLIGYQHL